VGGPSSVGASSRWQRLSLAAEVALAAVAGEVRAAADSVAAALPAGKPPSGIPKDQPASGLARFCAMERVLRRRSCKRLALALMCLEEALCTSWRCHRFSSARLGRAERCGHARPAQRMVEPVGRTRFGARPIRHGAREVRSAPAKDEPGGIIWRAISQPRCWCPVLAHAACCACLCQKTKAVARAASLGGGGQIALGSGLGSA
jgi:hypothetical protein